MRYIFALITVFLVSTFAHAQRASPTPTPAPSDDVVKISTNLIQLDVSVTDAKGNAITDLRADEIQIYENGELQKITAFSFISGGVQAAHTAATKPDPLVAPVPPTRLKADQIKRTFALVVDDLSLSFESAYQTRRALKRFVDEQMQDGDLIAIVRTGSGMGALQQFTSDKRVLYAAIEKVKWNPYGTGRIGTFAPVTPDPPTDANDELGEDSEAEKNRENAREDFRNSIFATGTLGAIRYVVSGMEELPGRKSVILFSNGFRLFERDQNGNQFGGAVADGVRALADLANRASVVIYSIDPRGLENPMLTAEDNPGGLAGTGAGTTDIISDRIDELRDTQYSLRYLAEQTGGFAVINNNDISGGVRKVLRDQSYYLIGYEPDSDTFDPGKRKFNKLEVKVSRKGAHARYRSGFFNVADKVKPAGPPQAVAGRTPVLQLQNALLSPFGISGIDVKLNALYANDANGGSFVRSILYIDGSDLTFTDAPGGKKTTTFELLAVSFGDNGRPIDQLAKSYTIEVSTPVYQKLVETGLVYNFAFPVKKPGAYQYRVALRDTVNGRLGSASQFIEVPDLKKKRLTLSSIVMESLTEAQWQQMQTATGATGQTTARGMADTALRRLKIGSVLRYGYGIYNAKSDPSGKPQVRTKVRVFRDGKLILDGTERPLETAGQADPLRLSGSGAIAIGSQMQPGDYILQVIVTDPLAGKKRQVVTQYIEFEVVP